MLTRRKPSPAAVEDLVAKLLAAKGNDDRFDAQGLDADSELHRKVHLEVFAESGIDDELSQALYQVQSDPTHDLFAVDAAPTLRALRKRGKRVAVLSDIHFDIRPAFDGAGMAGLVDTFVLSFEHRVQKPDPTIFAAALRMLAADPADTLMVGDRSRYDGAAVESGITTLLLPPLTSTDERRLHRVLSLVDS